LHPVANITSTFYLQRNFRRLHNIESIYEKKINKFLLADNNDKFKNFRNCLHKSDVNPRIIRKILGISGGPKIKWGINESIKAFEKDNVSLLIVSREIYKPYYEILKEYASIYKTKMRVLKKFCIGGCHCLVVKKV
jgi:hypothetical protein